MNLDDLNPAQRAAVLAPDGPILILAGAGSGKTRVLTYRIAHLLAERKAIPEQTLAVTFTNKAASEMRERVATLMGGASRFPWVSTFHSACARILRQEIGALGYDRNFSILDEGDAMAVIRRVLEDAQLADSPPPEFVRARIDQVKNEAMFPEGLAQIAADGRERVIAQLYALYQQRLREMNALDFNDLLLLTHRLFEANPGVLARSQERAAHLLVDEYQDTNHVQYLLVRALSARSGNLCVVGGEDQSIYRWRGADIRNILDFERDYPNAEIFKLEQNYRSTKTILAAADAVIQNNLERKPKRLWTENPAGELVTYYTGMTERDEADYVAREIARLVAGGEFQAADIVVFYRVNAQSRVLEEALVRRRIPYYVVGGLRFYEHREIKDLLAYLRVLAKQAGALYSWMRDLAGRVSGLTVRAILDEVLIRSGFAGYLEGLTDGQARRENVAEMLAAASAFDAERGGLAEFLERVALVNDSDQVNANGGRAALMTLHTSKGLEYPAVFIAGMEEGLFPHSRSQDSAHEVEEERRLCYVGMTRAQRLLYLTNTLSRELYGQRQEARPSRFLNEVASELMHRIAPDIGPQPVLNAPSREPYVDYSDSQLNEDELMSGDGFAIGAKVAHQTFGRGVVRRREGRGDAAKVWVNFERSGLKLLVLKFANLRPVAD